MSNFLDKDAILNSLTIDNVITILTDLGSAPPKDFGEKGLVFQTVCHGGSSFKLYYYHEAKEPYPAKIFHCYSGCSDTFNIYELVIRAKRSQGVNLTFYQAVNYVGSITNKLFYSDSLNALIKQTDRIDDWEWINQFKKSKTKRDVQTIQSINEHILEMFTYIPHEEWLKDGLTRSAMAEFEIGYWGKTNQITIPHRDEKGNLIGVRGRCLDEEDLLAKRKYVPLNVEDKDLSHSLGSNLYGIWQNGSKIRSCHKAILYESEKSVILNKGYFGLEDFSLATCGSSITTSHIKLLLHHLKVEKLILAYDKEFENPDSLSAMIYRNKLYKKIAPLLPYCEVSILWDDTGLLKLKQSPADNGKEVLLKMLDNKKIITMKDLEVIKGEKL